MSADSFSLFEMNSFKTSTGYNVSARLVSQEVGQLTFAANYVLKGPISRSLPKLRY